jgi:hypothetical protein
MAGRPPAGPGEQALRWTGLLATVAAVVLLGRMARKALVRQEP